MSTYSQLFSRILLRLIWPLRRTRAPDRFQLAIFRARALPGRLLRSKLAEATNPGPHVGAPEHEATSMASTRKRRERPPKLAATWRESSISQRYRVGAAALAIKPAFRGRPSGQLIANHAKSLEISPTQLYDAMRVAECWTSEEITRLSERLNRGRERRLTWSHLIQLTRVKDSKLRRQLTTALGRTIEIKTFRRAIDILLHKPGTTVDSALAAAGSYRGHLGQETRRLLSRLEALKVAVQGKRRVADAAVLDDFCVARAHLEQVGLTCIQLLDGLDQLSGGTRPSSGSVKNRLGVLFGNPAKR